MKITEKGKKTLDVSTIETTHLEEKQHFQTEISYLFYSCIEVLKRKTAFSNRNIISILLMHRSA